MSASATDCVLDCPLQSRGGGYGLGLTSDGFGSSGGQTFFQAVTEPLSVYGMSIY